MAGHGYAQPNTGASITPESSGNGALPTHQSEKGENKDNEANNRRIPVLRHSHDAVIGPFDEAGNEIERTSSRASSKSWKCELQSRQIGSNLEKEVGKISIASNHPMNKKGQTINSILAFLTFTCLTSYATADESITQEKVNQIRPGQTTEEDLVRTFGSPATETLCPVGERSLDWFYAAPISAQNYIPVIGPALGGTQVKAWELWVVVGASGRVKRYIAYQHYANGEAKRSIEYGHYPH